MKIKKLRTLGQSILSSILGGVLVVCLLLSVWNLYNQYNMVHQQTLDTLAYTNLENNKAVEQWLLEHAQLLESLADETGLQTLYKDRDSMEFYLASRIAKSPEILSVYMSTTENLMIDSTNWRPDETYIASEREWYIAATETDQIAYTEPYVDAQTGQMVMTISRVVQNNGELQGVMAMDIVTDVISEYIKSSLATDGGYAFLTNKSGNILAHPLDEYNAKEGEFVSLAEADGGVYKELTDAIAADEQNTVLRLNANEKGTAYYTFTTIQEAGWYVVSCYPASHERDAVLFSGITIAIICALCIALICWSVFRFSSRFLAPIGKVTELMAEVTAGNLAVDTSQIPSDSTEVFALASAADRMTNQNAAYINEINNILGALANGNFDVEPKCNYVGGYKGIYTALCDITEKLGQMFGEIRNTVEALSDSAKQASQGAQTLSEGVQEQRKAVHQFSHGIEYLTEQVVQNKTNIQITLQCTEDTTNAIERCSESVIEMQETMKEMANQSEEIGRIVKTIEEIAFQSNILSLNASVEAARAGEAGKGFIVVADEVRVLATQSSDAAKATSERIKATQMMVRSGESVATRVTEMIEEVKRQSTGMSGTLDAITQISFAMENTVKLLKDTLKDVSKVVEQDADIAAKCVALGEELDNQAGTMRKLMEKYRVQNKH